MIKIENTILKRWCVHLSTHTCVTGGKLGSNWESNNTAYCQGLATVAGTRQYYTILSCNDLCCAGLVLDDDTSAEIK